MTISLLKTKTYMITGNIMNTIDNGDTITVELENGTTGHIFENGMFKN